MTTRELREYAAWFHAVGDERILELSGVVQETPGFRSWQATLAPETLLQLGEWYVAEIAKDARVSDEMMDLEFREGMSISIPRIDMSERCFSLAFDVGFYLARVFELAYPHLVWKQNVRAKRFVDYGQPILTGFGLDSMNPMRMTLNIAYGVARGKKSGDRLFKIYETWSAKADTRKH